MLLPEGMKPSTAVSPSSRCTRGCRTLSYDAVISFALAGSRLFVSFCSVVRPVLATFYLPECSAHRDTRSVLSLYR